VVATILFLISAFTCAAQEILRTTTQKADICFARRMAELWETAGERFKLVFGAVKQNRLEELGVPVV
jgi:hypothetical protein